MTSEDTYQTSKSKYDQDFFDYIYSDSSTLDKKQVKTKMTSSKETNLDPDFDVLTSEEKKMITEWRNGINPFTGRSIKIWGSRWIEIMETNDWNQWVVPIDNNQKNKYNSKFLDFVENNQPKK